MTMRTLSTFLWKEWVEARSYKTGFLLKNVGLLLPLVGLFFLSRTFDSVKVPTIESYGGDYIAFALLGIVVATYSLTALNAFSTGLRNAQITGTLEELLQTRVNLPTLIVGWSLYPFLQATFQMLAFLVVGFLILGLRLDSANLASAALVLVLSVIVMASLGILAASFTLVFKRGNSFSGVINGATGLLSGIIYPVSVLPDWLQVFAKLIPHTHAIEALRLAVLQGHSIAELAPQLIPLLCFVAIVPVALAVFNYAMYRAKIDGSLAHY